MNKLIFSIITWLTLGFTYKAMSQETTAPKKDKETQQIVIQKKGDKDATLNITISGDKVTINGKPLADFKDDEITINNKKVIIREGSKLSFSTDKMNMDNFAWNFSGDKVYLGVSTEKTDEGAKITDVVKGSPAEKAGLEKNDIITKLDDKKIDGPQALYDAVNAKKEKDEVKVTYKRSNKEKTVKAVLGLRKSESFAFTTPNGNYKSFTIPKMPQMPHLNMAPYDNMLDYYEGSLSRRQKLGLKIQDTEDATGVKVLEVDDNSAAEKAGMKKDDVITQIGDKNISNTDEAREALADNSQKTAYTVKAKRAGTTMTFELKFPKKLKTTSL